MIKKSLFFVCFFCSTALIAQTKHILVDQFGYQTHARKIAVLVDPQVGYNSAQSYTPSATIEVRNNATNAIVFSGSPTIWEAGQTHIPSGDKGWWFDFSAVTANGTYYVHDAANNVSSYAFEIETEPYREVLRAATKMFYYNRSGFVKSGTAAGQWTDGMSFNNPLQDANCRLISDPTNASLEKDLSGGWFDNGDYNKRVTTAYSTVHNLLAAYNKNPSLFTDNWNWPESGNNVPDLLDEVKWELDWVLKMTNSDGTTQIKMGNQNYSDNTSSPPSANTDQRFYGTTCSSASIAAASILAHGAAIFQDFPSMQTYAAQLLARAEICYNYGVTFFTNGNFEVGCDDNSIVAGGTDWDIEDQLQGLLSASVYLFKATDNPTYQTFLINNGYLVAPLENNYWVGYDLPICDAFMYYSTLPNANSGMTGSIISSANSAVSNNWGAYFGIPDAGLYRDYMQDWNYYSGSNGRKATYGTLNMAIANMGVGDSTSLWDKGASVLHSFHGVNPLGVSYLSNMSDFGAENSLNEIYHSWFADGTDYDNAQTSLYGPPPGIMAGGPNGSFSVATLTPPYGQPLYKSYLDFNDPWPNNSWEVSEPSIDVQAAYIRLLSEMIGSENASLNLPETELKTLVVYPNPATNELFVSEKDVYTQAVIYDVIGNEVLKFAEGKGHARIDISTLPVGLYILKLETQQGWMTTKFQKK